MSGEEFVNLDGISEDIGKCYQIQVDDNGVAKAVYVGSFKDIPLKVYTTIVYDQMKDMLNIESKTIDKLDVKKKRKNSNKYSIHVVSYILPEESISNKIYKIVGLIVQRDNEENSLASLDLRYNTENGKYEYIYCDHSNDTVELVKELERFPGKDNVLKDLMKMIFEDPLKKIILS